MKSSYFADVLSSDLASIDKNPLDTVSWPLSLFGYSLLVTIPLTFSAESVSTWSKLSSGGRCYQTKAYNLLYLL